MLPQNLVRPIEDLRGLELELDFAAECMQALFDDAAGAVGDEVGEVGYVFGGRIFGG